MKFDFVHSVPQRTVCFQVGEFLRTVKETVTCPTFPPTQKTTSTLRASEFSTSIFYMLICEKLVHFQISSHMIFLQSKQQQQQQTKYPKYSFTLMRAQTCSQQAVKSKEASWSLSILSTTLTTYFSYNEPSSIKLLRLFPRRSHCTDMKSENTTF